MDNTSQVVIGFLIVYDDGEVEHGAQRFNTKAAARTYERFLQDNAHVKTVMIYDGAT